MTKSNVGRKGSFHVTALKFVLERSGRHSDGGLETGVGTRDLWRSIAYWLVPLGLLCLRFQRFQEQLPRVALLEVDWTSVNQDDTPTGSCTGWSDRPFSPLRVPLLT